MKKTFVKIIWIVVAILVLLIAAAQCGGGGEKSNSGSEQTSNADSSEEIPDTIVCNFEWLGSAAVVKLNVKEGTAQLVVKGKTYYGQCLYGHPVVAYEDSKEVKDCWIISGFTGTDKIDMTHSTKLFKGECWFWKYDKYIDLQNNFIYLNSDTYVAKNPDYRIPLTIEK